MTAGVTVQELHQVLLYFGALGLGGVIGATILFLIVKSFIPAYLAEKGKNLATREDIAVITREVEAVRTEYARQMQELAHQNSVLIEELKARSQLRLAAAERRLEAHQHAFSLWRKLVANVHGEAQRQVVNECYSWWEQNCIYLSATARHAFSEAFWAANIHPNLLQDRSNPAAVTANWEKLMSAGAKIVEGADLPALGEREILIPGQPAPTADPDARNA